MSELSKDSISIKSPAKINLHLEVIGKREDGYHELAMVMQNIDLSDYLKFNLNQNSQIRLRSDCHNLSLGSDNLIIKSANLLKKFSNKDLGADIFLSKKIPIGAGLAGGSSNAAATLIGLNKLWDLKFDYNKIFSLSKEIGSDVPFFINGGMGGGDSAIVGEEPSVIEEMYVCQRESGATSCSLSAGQENFYSIKWSRFGNIDMQKLN